jgi:succinoglycan biosynthesis transport protein ExoP
MVDGYYLDGPAQGGTGGFNLLDLSLIRGFLWRQRFILVGVTAVILILGYVVTVLTQPLYTATATVRVDPEGGEIIEGQEMLDLRGSDMVRYTQTLSAVLQSRSMAYQVVDKLKLASDPSFMGDAAAPKNADAKTLASRREAAASRVRGGLSVNNPSTDRIMAISYQSEKPAEAARIANAYVDAFVTDDLRRSFEKNAYAQQYLADQIAKTRAELTAAERRAISYARANKIVSPSLLGGVSQQGTTDSNIPQTVTASNLASVNSAYTAATTRRIAAEQRWRAVAGVSPERLPEVQQNPTYQNLVAARAKAASEAADLRTRYGDNYPRIVELNAQINTLDRQLSKTASDIKDGLRQTYEVAAKEEGALSGELNKVSSETLDEQDRRVAFNQMDRSVTALSTQLQSLLERYNQISSAANLKPGTITKLDAAMVPGAPSSPNLFKNLIVALGLGLGLAVALAVLRDVLDDRLRSLEDVERKLDLHPLGATPLVQDGEVGELSLPLAEAYSSIRTSIDFVLPERDHNVLMLTSSQASEGKSTTSVAIARRFAQLGRKVLLVEADLRKPSLNLQFGLPRAKKGFVEVLLGECKLEDALLEQLTPNLDVLPVGAIPSNPTDVLSSAPIEDFIARYRQEYSMIIFDAPPVMGLADAPLLSRQTDGVIFIIEANRAHFGQAKAAVRRLRAANANFLGVVMTKFRALEAGEAYDYHYSYYTYGNEAKS